MASPYSPPRQRPWIMRKPNSANHRQHGQDADAEGRNAKIAFDVVEEQRHRGYGRTQIESDQQHGHNRPGGMAQYSRRPPMGSAAVFRTAMPRPGLIGKDVHRSF